MQQVQQARSAANPQVRRGNFLTLAQRNRNMLADMSFTSAGDNKSSDVYATGFLSHLCVMIYGTITTGTSSAGTFDANYWPWNLVKRITLRSNAGLTFYDTDGFSNRLIQRWYRLGYDPGLQISPLVAAPYSTTGARVANIQFPTGARADSTAYEVSVTYLIPLVSHSDLRAGLLPLQNNATRVTLNVVLGSITDWLGSSGVLGAGGTVNLTARTMMEFFSVPNDANAMPDISYTHRIIQDTVPWTASGDQDYRVPVNGTILRIEEQFRNAGVPAKFFQTANLPSTANFSNQQVTYAASEVPEVYDFRFGLQDYKRTYLADQLDGCFLFDFAAGGGSIEMGTSSRDAYNTESLTEFKTRVTTSIAPSANSTIECVRQELQPRAVRQ